MRRSRGRAVSPNPPHLELCAAAGSRSTSRSPRRERTRGSSRSPSNTPAMATDPRKRPLSRVAEKARARLAGVEGDGWFFARIADQVAQQRVARNLSQRELAELVGTT